MAQSAKDFLNQQTPQSAEDFLRAPVAGQPSPSPSEPAPRQTRVMSADEFLSQPDPEKSIHNGFWADFGQATGGLTGLAKAPLHESIPAEAEKWISRNREEIAARQAQSALINPVLAMIPITGIAETAIAHMSAFLNQPASKPLGERIRDSFHGMLQLAKERPGLVVGSLTKGLAADPELFFLPTMGGARAAAAVGKAAESLGAGATTAKVAKTVASGVTHAATGAALGGGTELLREAGEGEPIDTGSIGLSAAIGVLASGAPLVFKRGPKPKMTPDEVGAVLATEPDPRVTPRPEVVATNDGYGVQTGGRQVATFATKAEADEHAELIRKTGSAYMTMGVAPPGSAAAERARLLHPNEFTPDKIADKIERPKQPNPTMTGDELVKFWNKAAMDASKTVAAAAIAGGAGVLLDQDDPATGGTFGVLAVLAPRALPKDTRISIAKVINVRNGLLAQMTRRTFQFKSAIEAALPDEMRRTRVSLGLEGHPGVQFTPEEAQVAAAVRQFFDAMGNTAVDAGVIKELLHNYVAHIVEDDPRANESIVDALVDAVLHGGGDSPKSGKNFAKERKYPTFVELQEALRGTGLKIKTTDIAEIVSIYSNAMFRTITDKRLLDALKATPVKEAPPNVTRVQDVRGPAPGPYARVTRAPIEGQASAPSPRLGESNIVLTRPKGSPEIPGVPTTEVEPEGFQLPNPPPDPVRGDQRGPRNLVQPVAHMDSDYVIMHNRQLAGYAVHRDIVPQLDFVFSARDPNDASIYLTALNQASKRALISFSMFHAKSLYDAFVGAMGVKGGDFLHPRKAALAAIEMYRKSGNNDDIDALLKEGLRVQPPDDVETDKELTKVLKRVSAVIDKALPVSAATQAVDAFSKFNRALEHFTFGELQTGFKLIVGMDALERLTVKGVPRTEAARMAASYANDIFGGLDWFRVAQDVTSRVGKDLVYGFFNPNGRRWTQLMMFAADWTASTFRAAYKALPGAVDDPGLAHLHRQYLAKSAAYYLIIANGINYVTAGHSVFSNANPTRIQLADGRTMQFSKHFMEPFEWLKDPIQTADNKLAFLPRALVELGTGKQYISAHDTAPDIESRALTVAEMFLPIPAQQGLAGGGAESVAGLVGMPIYGKTPDEKVEARREKRLSHREKVKKAAEYRRRTNQ